MGVIGHRDETVFVAGCKCFSSVKFCILTCEYKD